MDLENEKIGPAYNAPDSYFKESESRLLQRLGIDLNTPETQTSNPVIHKPVEVLMKVDTTGIQKRARKQDPLTSKSVGVDKEVDAFGKVEIPPLTFTTNENPEWVNFSAISEETSGSDASLNITKVTYGDLLNPVAQTSEIETNVLTSEIPESTGNSETAETAETPETPEVKEFNEVSDIEIPEQITVEVPAVSDLADATVDPSDIESPTEPSTQESVEKVIIHEVPESVGLDELESYIAPMAAVKSPIVEEIVAQEEPQIMNLEAPPTAFAPIAGRQKESATPGWLGIAASLAAIVAAYFIWNAIQPPKAEEAMATELQQDEPTAIETPLDEPVTPKDTIPDGLQLVEPLITGEMPKYKEPNVYTIIDAKEMPPRTKKALQDLEDNGLATFDMEDEMFEELDFESL